MCKYLNKHKNLNQRITCVFFFNLHSCYNRFKLNIILKNSEGDFVITMGIWDLKLVYNNVLVFVLRQGDVNAFKNFLILLMSSFEI